MQESTKKILNEIAQDLDDVTQQIKILNRVVTLGIIIIILFECIFIIRHYIAGIVLIGICWIIFIFVALGVQDKLFKKRLKLLKKDFDARIYGFH